MLHNHVHRYRSGFPALLSVWKPRAKFPFPEDPISTASSDPVSRVLPSRASHGAGGSWCCFWLASVGALGSHIWLPGEKVEAPAVDPDGAEPEVLAAIETAREEVRQAPRSAGALGHLGKLFLARAYGPEAGPCFTRAEKPDPNEVCWPFFMGPQSPCPDRISSPP
jgi:hypothetical protein